jgi:hypothetical protein
MEGFLYRAGADGKRQVSQETLEDLDEVLARG